MMADPRIVRNPEVIRSITYRELRELSYMGASVLHEDALFPVRIAGIPTNIRNTNNPDEPGTLAMRRGMMKRSIPSPELPVTRSCHHQR